MMVVRQPKNEEIRQRFGELSDFVQNKSSADIFSLIFDNIPQSIIVTNLEGIIIYVNQETQLITGYQCCELLGRSPGILNAEEKAEEIQEQIINTLRQNENWKGELRQKRKDGTQYWAEFEVFSLCQADGNPIAWAISQQDISGRKIAEKLLIEKKHRLKEKLSYCQMLNLLAESIIVHDDIQTILDSMSKIIGKTIGADHCMIYDVDINENKLKMICQDRRSQLTKVLVPDDTHRININRGSEIFFNNEKQMMESHADQINGDLFDAGMAEVIHNHFKLQSFFWYPFSFGPKGYYGLALTQMSYRRRLKKDEIEFLDSATKLVEIAIQKIAYFEERRKALEFIEEMEYTLKMTEKEKELILSSISELVVVFDTNRRIKWANLTAAEHQGLAVEDLIGRPCYEIWMKTSSSCPNCPFEFTLKTGNKHKNEMFSPDGSVWEVKTFPVLDADENIMGAVEVAKDITETRKVEREMARLERFNLIGEMAASFGHEIRNPMATVRGFLQMLSAKPGCELYTSYFDLMIEEMDRANSIISEFLSLARYKAIDLKEYNLNSIIDSIYPLMLADAIHSDKSIELKLSDIPNLLLDKKETHQLILNLVHNGLEAMASGGCLTIKTMKDENEVVMAIQDQGCGIAPEIMGRLGMPFVTTKENGTGLGLAICYNIVQRHQAKIEVDSNSSGTTFSIRYKRAV